MNEITPGTREALREVQTRPTRKGLCIEPHVDIVSGKQDVRRMRLESKAELRRALLPG